jgi:hypothetical protein
VAVVVFVFAALLLAAYLLARHAATLDPMRTLKVN